jgi:DNA-directed RNA polymerase specialized sigma24 family protein
MANATFPNVHNQSLNSNLIDDYVLARIDFRVRQLAGKFNLDENRQADCRQDMVVDLLNAAERFDPAKAKWHTFACRVLDIAVMRFTQLECRRRQREAGRPMGFSQAPDGCPSAVNNPAHEGHDDIAELELRLDVSQVMDRMPQRLRDAAEALKFLSPPEALGIHRNSIYRLIAEIRAYFEQAGLGLEISAADSACLRM